MIRTGQQYRNSIRDGRQVWINGERVRDVTTHPMFKPLVDIRARIHDMAHEARHAAVMTYHDETGAPCSTGTKLPLTPQDWHAKRDAVNAVLNEIGGIVTRVGDEMVGEMWSLYDGQDVLNEVNPQFSANIRRHVDRVVREDPFHVSANTDPKGTDRNGRRTMICCCMWSRRPMPVSSCAARNTKPPRPTPTRPSPSQRSPTG